MDRDIRLSNGELINININFYTLKLLAQSNLSSLERKIDKLKEKLESTKSEEKKQDINNEINALSYEMIGKIIYISLRSNGKKVDEEEAMILIPGDVDEIENIFNEFFKKMEENKKKEESKRQMREMMKKA